MWLSFLKEFPRKLKQNSRNMNTKYTMLQRRSSSRKNYFNRLTFPLSFFPFRGHLQVSQQVTSIHKYIFHFSEMYTIALLSEIPRIVCQYDLFFMLSFKYRLYCTGCSWFPSGNKDAAACWLWLVILKVALCSNTFTCVVQQSVYLFLQSHLRQ